MGTTTFSGPVKTGPVISGANHGGYRGKDLKDTQWVKNTVSMYFNEPAPADDNGICTAQTPAAAGTLTIDGALTETFNGNKIYYIRMWKFFRRSLDYKLSEEGVLVVVDIAEVCIVKY